MHMPTHLYMYMHTCIYRHTYIITCAHIQIHAYMDITHTHTHTCAHIYIFPHRMFWLCGSAVVWIWIVSHRFHPVLNIWSVMSVTQLVTGCWRPWALRGLGFAGSNWTNGHTLLNFLSGLWSVSLCHAFYKVTRPLLHTLQCCVQIQCRQNPNL